MDLQRWVLALLVAVAGTRAAPVLSQTPDRQKAARGLYEKGRTRFEAGDYTSAAALFDQSLRLVDTPHARLYRSVSLARSGDCPGAVEGLASFAVKDLPVRARDKGKRLWEEVWRTCAGSQASSDAPGRDPGSVPGAESPVPAEVPEAPAEPPEVPAKTPEAPAEPTTSATPSGTPGDLEATSTEPIPRPPPIADVAGTRQPSTTPVPHREVRDARGLLLALEEAPDGTTLVLAPGRYRLEHPVRITRALEIRGAGAEETVLVSDGEDHVLRFEGEGPFRLLDLTVEHDGVRPAAVLRVTSGQFDFRRLVVQGAVRHFPTRRGGQGLLVEGTAHGQVLSSTFRRNALHGIQAMGTASLLVEGCRCQENGQTGISWFESASGAARDNVLEKNDRYGIAIVPPARPQLSGNLCRQNRRGDLYLEDDDLPLGPGNDCPRYRPRKPAR